MLNKKITSIGEILFDVYPDYKKLGGAPFNFIYHINKITGDANFVSRIGSDDDGKEILSFLKKENIDQKFIQVDDERRTGIVKVLLDENKTPDFVIVKNSAWDNIKTNSEIKFLADNSDLIYFGTLAQRSETSRNTIQSFWGRDTKYFCDINLRQNYYSEKIIEDSLINSDVVKLNIDELKIANNFFIKQNFDLESVAKKLKEKFFIDLLCITSGDKGSTIFYRDDMNVYSSPVHDVVDTVGAGDSFSSILCIGYLAGWDIEKINKTASEFASEIVKVEGALPKDESIYNKYRELIND